MTGPMPYILRMPYLSLYGLYSQLDILEGLSTKSSSSPSSARADEALFLGVGHCF